MTPSHDSGDPPALLGRLFWLALGLVALALAVLGFIVPVFPGLPFAILAGLFFATASRRLHARLSRVPAMEGALHQWQRARRAGVRAQVVTAFGLLVLGVVETLRFVAERLRGSGRAGRR